MRSDAQAKAALNRETEANSRQHVLTRCRQLGLPEPVAEYRFCDRKWRFDLCWPDRMLALEFEGGIYSGGRHTRGVGFRRDLDKYNQAAILGWRILRVSHEQVQDDDVTALLEIALQGSPAPGP